MECIYVFYGPQMNSEFGPLQHQLSDVLLTVHLSIILAIDQLKAQIHVL